MKEVSIRTEYILLGQMLKYAGIIGNGGESKSFLANNVVKINGVLDNRRGKKLYNDDVVEVLGVKYKIVVMNSVK